MSIAEGSAVLSEEFKEDLIKVVNRAHRFHSITQDGAWSILALPSSPLLQQGPMCGITASIVAAGTLELTRKRKAWHFNSTASPENSQPSSLLDVPDDMESRLARLDIDSADLLKYAIDQRLSTEGEMFSSSVLAKLITDTFDCSTQLLHAVDAAAIVTALLAGHPVLIPYDAAPNHEPCLDNGESSHWAVLLGAIVPTPAFEIPLSETDELLNGLRLVQPRRQSLSSFDDCLVLARHGKSKHVAVWSLQSLLESNQQLTSPTSKDKYKHLSLPSDLSSDFNATAIVVQPHDR
eukprot:TRINITY_DN12308_c2_g8_i4.p1 TRINITY_DN12308_c2_g8~~TRINITY_DN12308_c2_g8_i4.p1  ORF type:complete len:293 (+),score=45.14 TRINITY_DN12308_c2_g8_i4:149-1027(+)